MKRVIILIFFILFVSCKKEEEKDVYNQIDLNAKKNLYKLFIVQDAEDNYYYSNKNGNCDVLVTNAVLVGGKTFGDFNNIHKAVAYARKIKEPNVIQSTTISIKKSNGKFEKTWIFFNPVDLKIESIEGGYGLYDLDISVDEAYFEYPNDSKSGIKIKFIETDSGKGFRMMILNFVRDNGKWKFLYKEKIDTQDDAKVNYCRDSIRFNGSLKRLPAFISCSDILDF